MTVESGGSTISPITMTKIPPLDCSRWGVDLMIVPSLVAVTATVYNDTDRVIVVSLYNSGTAESKKNFLLSALGLFLTVLGVPSASVGFAAALNLVSVSFGVSVLADTVIGSGEPVLNVILFPG
jgi:hypothetical protein